MDEALGVAVAEVPLQRGSTGASGRRARRTGWRWSAVRWRSGPCAWPRGSRSATAHARGPPRRAGARAARSRRPARGAVGGAACPARGASCSGTPSRSPAACPASAARAPAPRGCRGPAGSSSAGAACAGSRIACGHRRRHAGMRARVLGHLALERPDRVLLVAGAVVPALEGLEAEADGVPVVGCRHVRAASSAMRAARSPASAGALNSGPMMAKRSRAHRTRAGVLVSSVMGRAPYGMRRVQRIGILCVNQWAAASAPTKRDPSGTDPVVTGARQRASSNITSGCAGWPRHRLRYARSERRRS